jgi:hypothetical protein
VKESAEGEVQSQKMVYDIIKYKLFFKD